MIVPEDVNTPVVFITQDESCFNSNRLIEWQSVGCFVGIVRLMYPFDPHPGQTYCISQLLQDKRDLILIAKTSFGKSLIMQILALGSWALPVFVHRDNISRKLLIEINQCKYTHVLSSFIYRLYYNDCWSLYLN